MSLGKEGICRGKRQAVAALSANSYAKVHGRISSALDENLARIGELKDLIASHETNNTELALSNDAYRNEAISAVALARRVDDLQRNKERLAIKLTDKSTTVTKLLEDNYHISRQLHALRLGQARHPINLAR